MQIFVHMYKWRHDAVRARMRRALKNGEARIIREEKHSGWLVELFGDSAEHERQIRMQQREQRKGGA